MTKAWWLVVCCLAGCGGGGGDEADAGTPDGGAATDAAAGCVPDRAAWEAEARPIVEAHCARCHGEAPSFGAPFSLADYDAFLAAGRAERVVRRLHDGSMPPAGEPRPTAEQVATLLAWASCGEVVDAPMAGGFEVSRPLLGAPAEPPAGATPLDWRADHGSIGAGESDRYTCFAFAGPADGDRFIRRFEPLIDDTRVVHHLVLYRLAGGDGEGGGVAVGCGHALSDIVYAWAPGQGPVQFAEGGLRLRPTDRFVLEIHYNNAAAHPDVDDASGVRLYVTPPDGPEVGMLTLGPDQFQIPARTRGVAAGACDVTTPMRVVAAMPHMHQTGSALRTTIHRAGGGEEDLITLRGWDFDRQFFYDIGVDVAPGDRLVTECTFENRRDQPVRFGPLTEDEMCFDFVYTVPPPPVGYCDRPLDDPGATYAPGECAPDHAATIASRATGGVSEGVPTFGGGDLPGGRFALVEARIWFESLSFPAGTIDPERTTADVAGALEIGADRIALDMDGAFTFVAAGGRLRRDADLTFAGALTGREGARLDVTRDCGGAGPFPLSYAVEGDRVRLGVPLTGSPVPGVLVTTFAPL